MEFLDQYLLTPEELALLTPEEQVEYAQALQVCEARPERQYPKDPVGYARDILGVTLTPVQEKIARSLIEPPYKVMVEAGHSVGKTFLAAVIVCWWYDSFSPGIAITTAPTERDVKDLLWTEIRLLRQRALVPLSMDFIGPSAPEMRDHEEHYAKGYTAAKGESFQGRHRPHMLFVFDEAEGLEPQYWTTTKSMFKPEEGHAWLAILNPVTTTSAAYIESRKVGPDGMPTWKTYTMSAMDHPNILAELEDQPPPIANAVSLAQVQSWVTDWCAQVDPANLLPGDFEFFPKSGLWWRPGPIAEARIFGRRPSHGTYGVWSDALWSLCERDQGIPFDTDIYPEIGCDVARYGDDWTCFHARWGRKSIRHVSANGWGVDETTGHLKAFVEEVAAWCNARLPANQVKIDPKQIAVKIDDDGVGGGVVDNHDGYRFIGVRAGSVAYADLKYPNTRSELWFDTVDRALTGGLDLSLLDDNTRIKLKMQALAPKWKMDSRSRRVVEAKEVTKKELGRSPDDMDALNLAYAEGATTSGAAWAGPNISGGPRHQTEGERQGLFGRHREDRDDREDRQRTIRTLGR